MCFSSFIPDQELALDCLDVCGCHFKISFVSRVSIEGQSQPVPLFVSWLLLAVCEHSSSFEGKTLIFISF